jgi:hypothetical protein
MFSKIRFKYVLLLPNTLEESQIFLIGKKLAMPSFQIEKETN